MIFEDEKANQEITDNYYRSHAGSPIGGFGFRQDGYDGDPNDNIGFYGNQKKELSATEATEDQLTDGTILGKLNASGSNWEYTNGKYPTLKTTP